MNKKRFSIMIVLLIAVLSVFPLSAKSKFSKQEFDKFIIQTMNEWKVPGIAVGIIQDGKVILAQGYGYRDMEKKLPVTDRTLFAIGSTSKAFTAFIMGTLVDEGKVEWDQPVRTYLPDFKMFDPYVTEHMTPRDLLIHDSGLPRYDIIWYGADRNMDDLYKSLQYLEPTKGFRTTFQYQNLMYMTAGYLEAKIAGTSWQNLVKQRIMNPIGMKNSNFSVIESQKADDYALPYDEENGKIIPIPFYTKVENLAPAGAINSNIDDMLLWVKLNLQSGKWGDKQLINAPTLKMIHSPQMVLTGGSASRLAEKYDELSFANYGMGWFIQLYQGKMILHHGGNIDGFSAYVTFMPKTNSGIVILTNKNNTLIGIAVSFYIYDALLGIQPRQWGKELKAFLDGGAPTGTEKAPDKDKFKKENTTPSHPLADYAGEYQRPGFGSLFVSVKDNALYFDYNKISSSLKHYHYDTFEIEKGLVKGFKFLFHTDEKGDISAVSVPVEPGLDLYLFNRVPESKLKSPEFLAKFTGKYVVEINKVPLSIVLKGGNVLTVELPGQPPFDLIPYKDTMFNIKGLNGFSLEFVIDDQGKVNRLIAHQPNGNFDAKRVSDN